MANEKYITHITIPGNQDAYKIKDIEATEKIRNIENSLSSAINYRGKTTTNIQDNSTDRFITINGQNYEAQPGDVVIYENNIINNKQAPKEYIFDGVYWSEFGAGGALGELAFYNKTTGTVTLSGEIVEYNSLQGTENPNPQLKGATKTFSSNDYTPSGNLNIGLIATQTQITATGSIPSGVNISAFTTASGQYTPAGQISSPSFSGTEGSITVSTTTLGTINYTPGGTILADGVPKENPSVTISPMSETITNITNVGVLPSPSYNVIGEELKISWNAGSLPTSESKEVLTGISNAQVEKLTFSGTPVEIKGTYTPSGTVGVPSFTGNPVLLSASLTGTKTVTVTGLYTPNVQVDPARTYFSGTKANIKTAIDPAETDWHVSNLNLRQAEKTITITSSAGTN